MKEKILTFKETKWISLFFSYAVLSIIMSLSFSALDFIFETHNTLNGTVFCYTYDSIYVDVKWEVEYSYINLTENDITEIDSTITSMMNIELPKTVKKINYQEYLEYKEKKLVRKTKNTKTEIFKE